jgi:hypothetical protein
MTVEKLQGEERVRVGDDGVELLCTKCREFWPADGEFFYRDTGGVRGLTAWCRACFWETRNKEWPDAARSR